VGDTVWYSVKVAATIVSVNEAGYTVQLQSVTPHTPLQDHDTHYTHSIQKTITVDEGNLSKDEGLLDEGVRLNKDDDVWYVRQVQGTILEVVATPTSVKYKVKLDITDAGPLSRNSVKKEGNSLVFHPNVQFSTTRKTLRKMMTGRLALPRLSSFPVRVPSSLQPSSLQPFSFLPPKNLKPKE
jgi:hypothetical protein